MAKQTNTDLAVIPAADYAITKIDTAEMAALIRENTGGKGLSQFDLDRVSLPTGGSTMWQVPTIEGMKSVEELIGIVPHWLDLRTYWKNSYGEGESGPPDCSSSDLVMGIGDPGGPCATCPNAQFGSKPKPGGGYGRGQACSENRILFLMRAEDRLPLVIKLAPTSVPDCKKFALRLISHGLNPKACVWGISLVQEKSGDGIKYAKASFRLVERLSDEIAQKITDFAAALKPGMERAARDAAASE